eukprot:CAMPEP_0168307304 /NCGR_PEP_ID=MMETSP0142_2-20121227/57393_1 /TAXON_ID=44445 /ORGANISM="Pseudo-nitzschia australis, Strain 10249 10 AB" /LENGTH=32 /DNA_ID= /DNA_START= /DNA_END= /DNA_ORIENTATION=
MNDGRGMGAQESFLHDPAFTNYLWFGPLGIAS